MALPPWTVDLLRRGVQDLARQVTDAESAQAVKEQANKVVEELPRVAREKVSSLLKQAEATTGAWRDVWAAGLAAAGMGEQQQVPPSPLINGSGVLWTPNGTGVPVSPKVLSAGLVLLSGAVSKTAAASSDGPVDSFKHEIAQQLAAECGGTVRVEVMTSFDGALAQCATLGRRGGLLLVPRCCATPLETAPASGRGGGGVLADRLRSTGGASLREVGNAHRCTVDDLRDGLAESSRRVATVVHLDQNTCSFSAEELKAAGIRRVVVLPYGRLMSAGKSHGKIPAVAETLREGADAVILAGGVWTGTPECGLVVGRPELMESLAAAPRWSLATAPDAFLGMVHAAIGLQMVSGLPIDDLMAASEDNLRDRAERLAMQIAGLEKVASVRVTDDPATAFPASGDSRDSEGIGDPTAVLQLPSRQVSVTLHSLSAQAVADRLATGNPSLLTRVAGEELRIDLRWVNPEQQVAVAQQISQATN